MEASAPEGSRGSTAPQLLTPDSLLAMRADDGDSSPPIQFPTAGVNPRVAFATCVHSAPGVYAMLVGSGMSSAAGIRTGWQVVEDLIRKVAVTEGVDLAALGQTPEEWWAIDGRPEPRYDTLLPALASTDAARQTLLREYFDPPPERGGPILPTDSSIGDMGVLSAPVSLESEHRDGAAGRLRNYVVHHITAPDVPRKPRSPVGWTLMCGFSRRACVPRAPGRGGG